MNYDLSLAWIAFLAAIALAMAGCSNDVNHWEACCGDGLCNKTAIYPKDPTENDGPLAACWVSGEKNCGVCVPVGEQ